MSINSSSGSHWKLINYKSLCITLLTFGSLSLTAQQFPSPYLMHWTEEDGLCGDNVMALLQDQKGVLWLGTSYGLCRFDGKNFESFPYAPDNSETIQTNEVVELMEAKNGQIWIGTDGGGLSVYDYNINQFSTLSKNESAPNKSLIEDRVIQLEQNRQEEVLVGYRAIGVGKGGISIVNENFQIKEHGALEVPDYAGFNMKVNKILQDPTNDDLYWLGGRSFFCWNRRTNEIQEFPHQTFTPGFTSIYGILAHTDTTLLVGFASSGIWVFDLAKKKWTQQIHPNGVRTMFYSTEGKIWLIDKNGIGLLTPDTHSLHYILELNSENSPFPPETFIHSIVEQDDKLWIGTSKGLFCWSTLFAQFPPQCMPYDHASVATMPEYIGQLSPNEWLFIDRGMGLLLCDSLLHVQQSWRAPSAKGISKAILINNQEEQFVILGGASQGLFKWKPGDDVMEKWEVSNAHLSTNDIQVWSFFYDKHDQLWVGTRTSGLLRIGLQNRQLKQFLPNDSDKNSLCHDKFLFEIDEDIKGNLWICTDKGISIIHPQSSTFLHCTATEELSAHVIHSLESDFFGNFWIGTRDRGLYKYDITENQLTNFNTTDGLLYNGVNKMLAVDSTLWLATRKGLCKMNTATNQMITFDRKKGLLTNLLYNARLALLPDHKIMLSYQYSGYFTVFKDQALKEQHPRPRILLQSLRVLSSKMEDVRMFNKKQNITLAYFENYFTIDFQGIDYFQPRSLRYEYYLEGYDKQWIKAGQNTSSTYTDLPGGDYVFKVRVHNRDGQYSNEAQLSIHQQTAWYETTVFHACILLISGSLIYLYYHYRTQKIRREEHFKRQLAETEMKALRAQINPHFIFNCLNSIKSYIIDNKIEDGTVFVGRFAQLIRMILNHSKERLIPFSKEIEAIQLYTWLEQQRMKEKFEIDYQLDFQSSTDALFVPPLLFQPYIENAIWHGLLPLEEKGLLVIKISEEDAVIQIDIIDNGIGRKQATAIKQKSTFSKPSMGLSLTAKRFEQINTLYGIKATVKIEDQYPDQEHTGTSVTIIFPKTKPLGHAANNTH